jgi:hypothetical protein
VVTVQHGGNCGNLFREKSKVQFGVALLNHASQKSGRVDSALRFVHGTAIATHALLMTSVTVVLGYELSAHLQIGIFEQCWLGICIGHQEMNTQQTAKSKSTRV